MFYLSERKHGPLLYAFNLITCIRYYEKIRTISPWTMSSHMYMVCLVSQPKRKKGKKVCGQIKQRRLTQVHCMEFLVAVFHIYVPVQSEGGQVKAKQNARLVHFYWAQGNSQSKHR